MALGPRLDLRQSQQLVMTPQLQQAIKLLAASNLEIESFIGDALESNPLLGRILGLRGPVERRGALETASENPEGRGHLLRRYAWDCNGDPYPSKPSRFSWLGN